MTRAVAAATKLAAAARLALMLMAVAACGATPRQAPTPRPAFDTPFRERDLAPHTPSPAARTREHDAITLVTQGGEDQARTTALALVRAVLDGDATALDALLAERVTLVVSNTIATRNDLIERCLREAQSLSYEPAARADVAIGAGSLPVSRADRAGPNALAPGIRPNDLVVALPLLRSGSSQVLRRVVCLSDVYVRPGAHSEVVGLQR